MPSWVRAVVVAVIVVGAGYFFWSRPSEEELQREQVCRNWGYSDSESLTKCRESEGGVDSVIAPKRNEVSRKAVATFNRELSSLAASRTKVNESVYEMTDIGRVAKLAPWLIPHLTQRVADATSGKRFRLVGRIITNTPDPSDDDGSDDKPEWAPRTFQLWGPLTKDPKDMSAVIDIDIESLNRDERAFIQDHCEMISFTRCDAVIFGHVGRVSEQSDSELSYTGIVVDEIVIQPINPKTYRWP